MAVIQVRFGDKILDREPEREASCCLHCGADRDSRWVGVGRRRHLIARSRPRPFFVYDYTGYAFCNVRCLGLFWDSILRQHGKHFQQFIYRLACSADIPDAARCDADYLERVWKYAVKVGAAYAEQDELVEAG